LRTFTDRTELTGAVDAIPCAAIVGRPGPVPFEEWAGSFGWPITRIQAGHDLMLTEAAELADALHAAAIGVSPEVTRL
jgi:hypothetical protein